MISTFLQWGPLWLNLTSWIVLGGMNLEWVLMHWHWEPLPSVFSGALPMEQNSVTSRYMNSLFICSPEANCIPSCSLNLVPQTLWFAGCSDKINCICTTQQLHFQSCWCAGAFEFKLGLLSFCHGHLPIFFILSCKWDNSCSVINLLTENKIANRIKLSFGKENIYGYI